MALQSTHIKWILGELSVRTMPTMTGEQAEQIMTAQSVVKRALFQELKEAEARESNPIVPQNKYPATEEQTQADEGEDQADNSEDQAPAAA
jgi:hypothetical protein